MRSWFYEDFRDYAKEKGLQILKDDIKFIERTIQHMPQNEQREVMRNYLREWILWKGKNFTGSKNENLGRYRANTYLLNYATNRKKEN